MFPVQALLSNTKNTSYQTVKTIISGKNILIDYIMITTQLKINDTGYLFKMLNQDHPIKLAKFMHIHTTFHHRKNILHACVNLFDLK